MPEKLTAEQRKVVVENVSKLLQDNYVIPDIGEKMAGLLKQRLESGAYDDRDEIHLLAERLTADATSVYKDKHLVVMFNPEMAAAIEQRKKETEESEEEKAQAIAYYRHTNDGFQEIRHLTGHIGYIKMTGFANVELIGGETAIAAMQFVSGCDALIFDLRENGGGNPSMIQLITTYLFEGECRHINTFHTRPTDTYQQFWTLPHVPGRRMPDIPVYVLTSTMTFSAAEEFTYNLKHMERATIVGETTGGGGHFTDDLVAGHGLVIHMPVGRAINPITNSNWEGTGVEPHIAVPAADALKTAHIHALEQLIRQTDDEKKKQEREWDLSLVKVQYDPVTIEADILARYAGQYNERQVVVQDGELYWVRGEMRWKLTALSQTHFALDDDAQFEFILTDDDRVSALVLRLRNRDNELHYPRTGDLS